MLRKRPEMTRDGWKVGAAACRAACCTRATAATCSASPRWRRELVDELAEVGARFTHHSSIAPTGTISLSLANNASQRHRAVVRAPLLPQRDPRGPQDQGEIDVFSFELLAYRELVNRARCRARTDRGRQAAGVLHDRRRHHAARARRHPGGGAEVGRLVDLEDGQRARPTTATTTSRTSTCTPTSRA